MTTPPSSEPQPEPPAGGGMPTNPSEKGCAIGCLVVVGLAILITFVSCLAGSGSSNSGSSGNQGAAANKYTQTWTKSYSSTTCDEWLHDMTSSQKFAAAADMLASARNKIDGGSGIPSDSLISEFQGGISNVCQDVPTWSIAETAVLLYQTEPRFKP